MQRYHLEFILHVQNATPADIKNSLAEFSENLEVSDSPDSTLESRNLKIRIITEEPTAIFDICSQFGRIRSIKIDERSG
jgi:dihydroxyacetone kinase-like predicted kinase